MKAVIFDFNGTMTVVNAKEFRCILREQAVEYLTPEQYAERVGRKRAIVVRLCLDHRIPGARQVGARWIIPADAPYPEDARFGSRIKRYTEDV